MFAGRDLYFDTETNGLLPELHTMHCLGVIDMRTDEEFYFGPAVPAMHRRASPTLCNPAGTVEEGVRAIQEARLLVAHNGIDFDYKAIEMLYPWFKRPAKSWDSMVTAKVIWPYDVLAGPDFDRQKRGLMPMQMVKRHSLKAWGYRLGDNKEDYQGDLDIADPDLRKARLWSHWSPDMAAYMLQDCRPGVKLWKLCEERMGWTPKATAVTWPELVIEVEHEVARILKEQELGGITFDMEAAQKLAAELSNEQARLSAELKAIFGSWWQPGEETRPAIARNVKRTDLPDVTIRRYGKAKPDGTPGKELAPYVGPPTEGYDPEAPFTPVVWTEFNASSRDHLAMRLEAVYGWVPKKFGKTNSRTGAAGKPTVDESTLEEIPDALIPKAIRQTILDYFVVSKTYGTLAKGAKSWLNLVGPDGRIHGQMDSAGAITGRGTHKNPNLSGTPKVRMEKVVVDGVKKEIPLKGLAGRYGWECRALFTADPGWEQTGVDATGLELVMLGHYLFPKDEGAFSARVSDPTRDPHQEHADLIGVKRNDAKTAIYLRVYGGSAFKLSLDTAIIVTPDMVPEQLGYRGLPMILKNLAKRFDQKFVDDLDDMQKARIAYARQVIVKMDSGIPGLKELSDEVTAVATQRGWVKGLDGRRVVVRSPHAALNTLLQSAGAQAIKLWLVLTHQALRAAGYEWGRDYRQIIFSHDEAQFTHKPGLGPVIEQIAKRCLTEAGVILKIRGALRGEAKHGPNWATCH